MSFIADDMQLNQKLRSKVIASAASSLTQFAIKFEDGTGLLCEVSDGAQNSDIITRLMPADELPEIGDAICKVEWAWISSSKVESITKVSGNIEFQLSPAGKLNVLAQLWKGSPFLAFMPYKGN